jgi:hypothetical protein
MGQTAAWCDVSLRGVFDLHVHAAPDVRPRWYTAFEMAERAAAEGMAGFVLKNHDAPTVMLAEAVRRRFPELQVFGGLVLNRSAGGLDPERVRDVLGEGARIIWLPTHDGCGECRDRGRTNGLPVIDSAGELLPALRGIIDLIASADAVLATGHVAADEAVAVVRAARDGGVRRILVNHPEIPFLKFPPELQVLLRDAGAILEHCYPRPEDCDGFDGIASETRAAGVASVVLATDLGRTDLPCPIEGFRRLIYELRERGFREEELSQLTSRNPMRFLMGAWSGP